MRLLEEGAHPNAGIYELKGDKIRLSYAAGQVMSGVKEKFQKERLPMNYADKTICAGALEDAAAVRGDFEPFKTTSIFDSTAQNPEWLGEDPQRLQQLMPK